MTAATTIETAIEMLNQGYSVRRIAADTGFSKSKIGRLRQQLGQDCKLAEVSRRPTVAQLARLAGISVRSMHTGFFIQRYGVPELRQWLLAGVISLHAAELITRLNLEYQHEIVAMGPDKAKAIVKNIRRQLRDSAANVQECPDDEGGA